MIRRRGIRGFLSVRRIRIPHVELAMAKIRTFFASAGVTGMVLAAGVVHGADPMLPGNPLTDLPSLPGSTIDAIAALGDNEWLNLGPPAADPVWGVARGRSWGGHSMVSVFHLRGAFYTGEGVHAYVKPDGYGMDDYWFYDINAHAWICLYPGTNTLTFNQQVADGDISVDLLGRPVNASGQPVPGHLMIHAWRQLAYDHDLNKIIMFRFTGGFGRYFMPGGDLVEAGIAALEAQGLHGTGTIFGPWAYNTASGSFELEPATNASPNGIHDYGVFSYISSIDKYIITDRNGTSFFDPVGRTWSPQGDPAPGIGNTYDFSGAYDATRDRLYVAKNESSLWSFDIQSETWTTIAFPAAFGPISVGPNRGAVTIDTGNDVVLIWAIDNNTVYSMDPDDNSFDVPIEFDSSFINTRDNTNAIFYDPVLGVHFIFTAHDSGDNGEMWVFKYRRPGAGSSIFADGFESGDTTFWSFVTP